MTVEDDGRQQRERRTHEDERGNRDADDDDVAEQSPERPDLPVFEYLVLSGEHPRRIQEALAGGAPTPGVDAGDEKVVEVDADADDRGVREDEPERKRGVDGEDEQRAERQRDDEMVFRVDDESPVV